MNKIASLLLLGIIGCFSLEAEECCVPANEGSEINMTSPTRTGVQLFYSSPAYRGVPELREKDYEWPGMNEDTFYDFFTK